MIVLKCLTLTYVCYNMDLLRVFTWLDFALHMFMMVWDDKTWFAYWFFMEV